MLYLGLLNRIVPFFLTFAAGLMIASFFVPVGLPSVGSKDGRSRCRKHRMVMQENADLKEDNRRLNERLAAAETRSDWYRESLEAVPAPAVPELPPPPPVRVRGTSTGHATTR
jgi:hypothetical protein